MSTLKQIFLTSTLALTTLTTAALASPFGPYAVGEVGVGYPNGNQLQLTIPSNTVNLINTDTSTSGNLTERLAIGDYLMQPDSVTSIGLELGFNYFNQQQTSASAILSGVSPFTASLQTHAWSTTVEGIASFDIFARTDFFAKLGLGYAAIQREFTQTSDLNSVSVQNTPGNSSGLGISGGLGFQVALAKNVGLRIETDGLVGTDRLSYAQGLAGLIFGLQM